MPTVVAAWNSCVPGVDVTDDNCWRASRPSADTVREEHPLDVDELSDTGDAEKVPVGEDEASVTNAIAVSKSCSAGAWQGASRRDSDSTSEDGLAADMSAKGEKTSKMKALSTQKRLAYGMAK